MPGGSEDIRESESAVRSASGVRKFTWEELSKLNEPHNAHVAVRGKVRQLALVRSVFGAHPLSHKYRGKRSFWS